MRMDWERDLDGMLRHGTEAVSTCVACQRRRKLDIADLHRRLGGRATLWDYFMPCWACPDGLTFVSASPARGTPMRPLKSYLIMANADGGWDFMPIWRDTPPFRNGID
jgi:hypothetical protein